MVPERRLDHTSYTSSSTPECRSFRERSLQFVLDRVIHDFSNAVGGIASLTDHHLQYDRLDPRLEASLRLIHESAEQCRALLFAANGAFDSSMNDRAYMHAGDLAGEVGQLLQVLLPRSIRFKPMPPCSKSVVQVRPADFKARWLAIASLDCQSLKGAGQVEFGCTVENDLCWFWYRSSNPDWPDLSEIGRILWSLAGVPERTTCEVGEEGLVAGAALPLEFES